MVGCDTSVKMRISMEAEYKMKDIQKIIHTTKSGIMITGGEPTVPKHFDEALALLNHLDYPIANVESNGFQLKELINQAPKSKLIHYMYSPKIFGRKDVDKAISLTEKLLDYDNVYFKIVYEENFAVKDYCVWLSKQIQERDWGHRVWLMPEGSTRADLIKNSSIVFDAAERLNFNFSSRNHLIFGFI